MTIYKLKEDWSSFKAGEKFTASSYGNLYQLVDDDGKLADGKLVLAKIQPDLLTVIGGGYAWRPNEDGAYHYIDGDGVVLNEEYYIEDDHTDKGRLAIGNCFKTAQEANSMCDWLKTRQRLIESGAVFMNASDANKGDAYYNVTFDKDSCELMVRQVYGFANYVADRALYFTSCDDAKRSVDEHRSDWLTYLGVREKSDGNS